MQKNTVATFFDAKPVNFENKIHDLSRMEMLRVCRITALFTLLPGNPGVSSLNGSAAHLGCEQIHLLIAISSLHQMST
jgi:hypothetical protein